jgi:hypothetical protein
VDHRPSRHPEVDRDAGQHHTRDLGADAEADVAPAGRAVGHPEQCHVGARSGGGRTIPRVPAQVTHDDEGGPAPIRENVGK